MKKSIALLFVASTLFFAGCCTAHHTTAWEYKVVSGHVETIGFGASKDQTLNAKINLAATEGWQVVSSGADGDKPYVILRRPK